MYKEFILSFTNGFGMLFYAAVIKPILSAAASDLVNPNLTILGTSILIQDSSLNSASQQLREKVRIVW